MNPSMQELILYCEKNGLDQHPFLQELRSRPADLTVVHDIMANAWGFASNFTSWLAAVISRLDDPRLMSVLAKQLNDELGNGDASQIHTVLYQQMLDALRPWKAASDTSDDGSPGKMLQREADRLFRAADPYEALGAVMAGEIFAAQFDEWLGGEFARQQELDLSGCTWYNVHDELEREHADDSTELAGLVPDSDAHRAAVWRGAKGIDAALRSFLDAMSHKYRTVAA